MSANYQAWISGFAPIAMGNPERPELADVFAATLMAIRPDILIAVARLIFQSDHRADLPTHPIPTLIVQSRDDIAVPVEVGEYLAQHIPHAELDIIDARGHFPHVSAPAAVIKAICSYFC